MKHITEALLNTAEAARFLRVSQASIRRWSDSGRLPSHRIGGRRERRFRQSDLVAFMESQETTAESAPVSVGGVKVAAPTHLSPFYGSDAGRLRLTVPFLIEGLRLGQPCILVAAEPVRTTYLEALSAQGGVELGQAQSATSNR